MLMMGIRMLQDPLCTSIDMWHRLEKWQKRLALVVAISGSLSALGYGAAVTAVRPVLAYELKVINKAIAMNTKDRLIAELVRLQVILPSLPAVSPQRVYTEQRIKEIQRLLKEIG